VHGGAAADDLDTRSRGSAPAGARYRLAATRLALGRRLLRPA